MEKTIFLFRRAAGRSREEFDEHYIAHHAPLGVKLVKTLKGYTVNLVDGDAGPDAVTEHWLNQVEELLDPTKAYASMDDAMQVIKDDQTFIGSHELYVVTSEIETVPGERSPVVAGQASPGVKIVWCLRDEKLPPAPIGARRVVDNRVSHKLVHQSGAQWARLDPDIKVFRMAWAPRLDDIKADLADALVVREFPFIAPPPWRVVIGAE